MSQSSGPSYTKAYLDELKAGTPSTPVTRPPNQVSESDIDMDVSLDLEGTVIENVAEMFPGTFSVFEDVYRLIFSYRSSNTF